MKKALTQIKTCVLAFICLAQVFCFASHAEASAYSLREGDVLSIYVYRQDDLSVTVRVDSAGSIRFPMAGRIQVLGKDPNYVESVIAKALGRNGFDNPQVVVNIASFADRQIFVIGELGEDEDSSGGYAFPIPVGGTITAMQAISAAGGLSESANLDEIIVRRVAKSGKVSILSVPAKAILMGKPASDVVLQPSDTVVVPKASPVSVLGTVKRTGQFYISPNIPMTVSMAISLAGGVERPQSLSEIRITRGKEYFKVDIQSVLEDGTGDGDVLLKPGDIVYVPETRW